MTLSFLAPRPNREHCLVCKIDSDQKKPFSFSSACWAQELGSLHRPLLAEQMASQVQRDIDAQHGLLLLASTLSVECEVQVESLSESMSTWNGSVAVLMALYDVWAQIDQLWVMLGGP
jgi:hypothetical protein